MKQQLPLCQSCSVEKDSFTKELWCKLCSNKINGGKKC